MAKIYRRANLISGTRKKQSDYVRKRNVIMNFRVSEEERQLIDERIRLSGLTKSEFFIDSCMNQKIKVLGNIKTFDAIRETVSEIDEKLIKLQSVEELDEPTLESLRMILELLDSIYNEKEEE